MTGDLRADAYDLVRQWDRDVTTYPATDPGRWSAAAVRACATELRALLAARPVQDEDLHPITLDGERDATPDEAYSIGYSIGHIDGYREGHPAPAGDLRERVARIICGAVYGDPGDLSRGTKATDAVMALLGVPVHAETRNGDPCGRGICAANEGHEGTCAEASGWIDL